LEEENFKIREKTDKVKELLKKTIYEGKRLKEKDLKLTEEAMISEKS